MSGKWLWIGSFVLAAGAFSLGRYTTPVEIKEVTKTVEVEKKKTEVEKETQKDVHRVERIIRKPDGTTETTIQTDSSTKSTKNVTSQTDAQAQSETSTSVVRAGARTRVAGVAAIDIYGRSGPAYGVEVSRSILGPISVGGLGLSNGTFGLSLGLEF